MDAFNQLMQLLQTGVVAYGTYELAFGFMGLASGFKEKVGSEIARGFGGCVAGSLIIAAAYIISTIKVG